MTVPSYFFEKVTVIVTSYFLYSLNLNQSKSTDYQWNLTDLTVKINWYNSEKYVFTYESVKRQITDSISENLTDSDLESRGTYPTLLCTPFAMLEPNAGHD